MSTKTLAVNEEQKRRFIDYQFESRSRSQTEALKKLLDLADKKNKKEVDI